MAVAVRLATELAWQAGDAEEAFLDPALPPELALLLTTAILAAQELMGQAMQGATALRRTAKRRTARR